jgi:hypothetical protein
MMIQKSRRPRSPGHGLFSLKRNVRRVGTSLVLRGQEILRCEDDDMSPVSRYAIHFLNYRQSTTMSNADRYKKSYVRFLRDLWILPTPPRELPPMNLLELDARCFLKLWIKQRWRHDQLESFDHEGSQYSLVSGAVCIEAPLQFSITTMVIKSVL